ncbi:MAG TPA: hypothetical protein VKQ52_19525, partial [Puia sp.]|nr:hypothetical protein [Puia sp.]
MGASTGIKAGAFLSRPTSTNSQSYYWSTDSVFWSYDGPTGWKDLKPGSGGGGTVTTDTTLVGNGSGTPLGLNSNLVTSANYYNRPYPLSNSSLGFGTSIYAGYGITAGLAGAPMALVQSYLNNTVVNNGAVASTAVRTAYNYISANMPQYFFSTLSGESGFNNIRTPISGDTLHRFGHVKAAYRALAALLFSNQSNIQFYFIGTGTLNPNITTSLTCSGCTAPAIDTLKDFSSRTVYYRANVPGF